MTQRSGPFRCHRGVARLVTDRAAVRRSFAVAVGVVALGAAGARAEDAPQPNPERNAYFGETHIHTSWSLDAWVFGNHLTGPADSYRYAKGEPIKHPLGCEIRIETPLDFMGVTDHSE